MPGLFAVSYGRHDQHPEIWIPMKSLKGSAIQGSFGYPENEKKGESLQLVEGIISPFQEADKTAFSKEIRREIQFRISHTLRFYEIST